jgi:HSP20 family protein
MSTLTLWTRTRRDPFAEFDALVRQAFGPVAVRRTTRTSPARISAGSRPSFGFTPAADVSRQGDDAIVRVEVPGLDPEKDVAVELTGRQLVIRGERRDEQTREEGGRTLRELRYGSFRRTFQVPRGVSADAITATYDAGVLSVRVAGAYSSAEALNEAHRIAVTAPAAASEPEAVEATEAPTAETGQPTAETEQPAA